MGFRTILVSSRCKLEFRLNYLIVRGEQEKRIFINEINTLIIQSTAVSLTAALLCELSKNNVKVIFCDEKCSPQSELVSYYGTVNTTKRYKNQFCWKEKTKKLVWQRIIVEKIRNQATHLLRNGFEEANMLFNYAEEVMPGDSTNREGHAAKVYFNCLLPDGVSRHGKFYLNGYLNYGYAVLLSAFNREIVASGYLTQIGIWHDNEFNAFNFSCDLMEPLRPIVDEAALGLSPTDNGFKKKMAGILNYSAMFKGKNTALEYAIRSYVKSVLSAMEKDDPTEVAFPTEIKIPDEQ